MALISPGLSIFPIPTFLHCPPIPQGSDETTSSPPYLPLAFLLTKGLRKRLLGGGGSLISRRVIYMFRLDLRPKQTNKQSS